MALARQVFPKIAALLDDDDRDFATDQYLVTKLQLALDKLVLRCLNNPNMGTLKTVVELPNVPAGTRSLRAYFEAGNATTNGPLALLSDLIDVRERPAAGSRNEQDWIMMDPVPNLPAVQPTSFNRVFLYTYDDIKLLGADQAVDMRIFGKFTPTAIKDGDTPVPPNCDAILAYGAAAIVANARRDYALGDRYESVSSGLIDDLFANAIMMQQAMRIRMKPFATYPSQYR